MPDEDPFLKSIRSSLQGIPKEEKGDYVDPADGLLHCGKCRTRKQKHIHFPANDKMPEFDEIIPIYCQCYLTRFAEEKKQQEEQLRKNRVIDMKRHCFDDTALWDVVFAKDDKKNLELTKQMYKYAKHFQDVMLPKNLGLILWGGVGTGKTFYATCIANYVIEQGLPVKMTSIIKIANEMQGWSGTDKQDFIDGLQHYALLILDDLGAERTSDYVREVVYNVINSRYDSKLPLIATTNMTEREMKYTPPPVCERIYDRLLEMCHLIEIKGDSRRREKYKARNDAFDKFLKGEENETRKD